MSNAMIMVTPLGHMLLRCKKAQLERVILDKQEGLGDMAHGDPGDGFQDGFQLDTQMNIQMMERQLREISRLLEDAVLTTQPQQTKSVSLGHKAWLTLTYPSGEQEELTVVLTASQELALVEDHLLNGELPVSPNSALGKAIYGQKTGAEFSYDIEAGTVRGRLLKIEIWQHAFELPEYA